MSYGYEAVFRPPREDEWRALARSLSAQYCVGGLFEPESLRVSVPPWMVQITLDTSSGQVDTVLSAAFVALDSLALVVAPGNSATPFGAGDSLAAQLFEPESLQTTLLQFPGTTVIAGLTGVRWRVAGVIREPERLQVLIEAVAELLQRLRDTGRIAGGALDR